MSSVMTFCNEAAMRMARLATRSTTNSVLVSVKGGGCSGLRYLIQPTNEPPEKLDETIQLGETNVIVCGHSLPFLFGTTVSWEEGDMGAGFAFENPNAAATCGCGDTFQPNDCPSARGN
jgi:iron-sulfur cluster assembly accessory protein